MELKKVTKVYSKKEDACNVGMLNAGYFDGLFK